MFSKSSAYFILVALVIHSALDPGVMGAASNKAKKKAARIVGGNANFVRNFPYIAQLYRNGNFICAGTVISQRHILTAAHCVMNDNVPSALTVVAGAGRLGDAGTSSRVSKIIRPRNFSLQNMENDAAVLRTARPLVGRNIRRIRLCNADLRQGMVMRVSGWGARSENRPAPSRRLRVIKVPVVARATCSSQYNGVTTLTNTMFCAAKRGKDSCFGDSGGPAVRNGRVCGIVSFGNGCARTNYPGVYTDVTRMRSFINQGLAQ
uniref:Peptidase S1 domain-containing protein n=1 Tax=Stomoxys calcitrans TaxID=35570 RepID=A0A1I8Q4U7_STOCA